MSRRVRVRVEELVLDGMPRELIAQRQHVGRALAAALEARLAGSRLPATLSGAVHLPHVDGGAIEVPAPGARRPEQLGARVAEAVWRGLGGPA